MPCCSWEQFEGDLPYYFRQRGVDPVLIDWDEAKKFWRNYHCTPGEVADVQITAIKMEGDYLFLAPRY